MRSTKSSNRFASNKHSASRHRWSLPDRLGHNFHHKKRRAILKPVNVPNSLTKSGLHISSKCAHRRMTIINIRLRRHHKTMKTVMADVNKNHTMVPNKKSSSCRWLQWPWYGCKEDYTSYGHIAKNKNYNCPEDYRGKSTGDNDGKGNGNNRTDSAAIFSQWRQEHPEQLDAGWS